MEGEKGGAADIGGRRELFWDDELLEEYSAEFRMEPPVKKEIVLRLDRPWEGRTCNYFHVFRDGEGFRLYYRASDGFLEDKLGKRASLCLLTSADGIRWERPSLGLVEFGGTRDNNILITADELDNFFVFRDGNPACPPAEGYKAVAQGPKTKELPNGGLWAYVSADGLVWKALSPEPVIRDGYFDSLNTVHWDPALGKYRLYFRGIHGDEKTGRYRDIRLALSEDFRRWGEERLLSYGDAPELQLYTNGILPYYRAPHLRVGFPVRYVERQWEPMFEQLPHLRWRREKMERYGEARLGTALTEGRFMTSRDGIRFRLWDEPFLRPGPFRENNWVYGDCYQGWGLLETPGEDPLAPREISFFTGEDYSCRPVGIRRYAVRLDGFACLRAGGGERQALTKPLLFAGDALTLNMSTGAGGFVMAEFLGPRGEPIPGYSGGAGYRMFGDDTALTVLFRRDGGGAADDLSALEGKPVRIRFTLKEASLYSMRFVRRSGSPGGEGPASG